jgi:integrase
MTVKVRKRMDREGAWQVDVRGTLPDGTRYRERLQPPVMTESAARRWGEQREATIIRNGGTKAARAQAPSLSAFRRRFEEGHLDADGLKPSTAATIRGILDKHVEPAFGGTRLDAITSESVQRFKGALVASGRSPKTVNNILTVLSTVLRHAVAWDVVEKMPCTLKLLKVPPPAFSFYEFGDYGRLLDAARALGPRIELMVLFGGDAGLRRGEIIALEWSDIDFPRASIHVQRSDWNGKSTAPKGGRSRRVPMTQRLAAVLRAHRHLQGPRVLCHEDGSPVAKKTLEYWLAKATRGAGLPVSRELHALRHTFCSHLAMQGAPAKAIQELAGHANLSTTLRYMHLSPAAKDAAVRLLDARPKGDAEGLAPSGHQSSGNAGTAGRQLN